MVCVVAATCALSLAVLGQTARSQARIGTAVEFFGAKKVYTFHLTIEPAEWTKMSDSIAFMMGPGGPGGQGGMRGQPGGPGGSAPGGLHPRGGLDKVGRRLTASVLRDAAVR